MRPITHKSTWNSRWRLSLLLLSMTALLGCESAPSVSIAGSFFPDSIFCCLIGILLAVAAYRLFARLKMKGEVQPAVLIYPCIALSGAVTVWLFIFG
jgi:NhaP-type Na+/H+ or K+/H+ antiporter